MKLATVKTDDDTSLALFDGRDYRLCKAWKSVDDWLNSGPVAHAELRNGIRLTELPVIQNPRLLSPIQHPSKILCVGRNYAEHAAETGAELPSEPLIFCKLPTTLRGDNAAIELPTASRQIDFEAELVAVIGQTGRNIPPARAFEFVIGYMCGNDVTARDWQKGKPGGQWLLGKSFDSFCPVGPHLVTADEIPNPHDLEISLSVNGERMQHDRTSNLLFRIDSLIAYVSQVCTLSPGDLLFTGTPSGVGMVRTPPRFLQAGDEVEVMIRSAWAACEITVSPTKTARLPTEPSENNASGASNPGTRLRPVKKNRAFAGNSTAFTVPADGQLNVVAANTLAVTPGTASTQYAHPRLPFLQLQAVPYPLS